MVRMQMGKIFLFGVCLSTLLGIGWMFFLYLCAGVAVYLALFGVGLVLAAFSLGFAYRGGVGGSLVNVFVSDLVNGTIANIEQGLSSTVASGVITGGMLDATMDVALVVSCGFERFEVLSECIET